jgi:hypothetical protein
MIKKASLFFIVVAFLLTTTILFSPIMSLIFKKADAASGGHDGHNLPASELGNRKAMLNFETNPKQISVGKNVDLKYGLIDENTGKSIPHITSIISIFRKDDDKRVFTEVVHGHDGQINIQFLPSNTETYSVKANYDTLAASYVSDYGSPIKIDGPVFSQAGNYTAVMEVTGVDFDNTFLPEPLKYEFDISVLAK